MNWLWINLALGAFFVLAIVGIPLWIVIARPDTGPPAGPRPAPARRQASARPAAAPARPLAARRGRL